MFLSFNVLNLRAQYDENFDMKTYFNGKWYNYVYFEPWLSSFFTSRFVGK